MLLYFHGGCLQYCLLILWYVIFALTQFIICFFKIPKNNNSIFKILTFIGILGFVISFPVSWYANYKFNNLGYSTCYKLSWNAPSKYVKNPRLCH
ncbi:DUF1240 domain-containing protein [Xenorhabdus sp. IM139775]|uniref:DUF1240 domain-containing protein n=1 Tax=Xenorhabdus sp. IM139775 TaxID=3025876 RepID=UPI003FD4D4BC